MTINFAVQLLVDLLVIGFVDRIGYRVSILIAHIFSAGGVLLLTVLPDRCSEPFDMSLTPHFLQRKVEVPVEKEDGEYLLLYYNPKEQKAERCV